jgi:hypothetical protein
MHYQGVEVGFKESQTASLEMSNFGGMFFVSELHRLLSQSQMPEGQRGYFPLDHKAIILRAINSELDECGRPTCPPYQKCTHQECNWMSGPKFAANVYCRVLRDIFGQVKCTASLSMSIKDHTEL